MFKRLQRRISRGVAQRTANKTTFDVVLESLCGLPPGIRQTRVKVHRGKNTHTTPACVVRNGAPNF